ncbi:MAG TPA: adenylate/guanylate cyclase domain-containing protein [Candidatus Aquilonibacter sp.]|nr:adenylate/guanylate cyclase domain-containing protein [Candidatus Aquilonibacter sp.]
MSTKVRTLLIALALGALASAVGITMYLLPYDSIPLIHRVTDLQTHYAGIEHAPQLGFGTPWYDSADSKTSKIVVMPIDEVSFASKDPELHQFPYSRAVYGTLLKKLAAAGAKVAVFDIDFIEQASEGSGGAKADDAFIDGMKAMPTILAFTMNTTTNGNIGIELPYAKFRPYIKGIGSSTVDEPGRVVIGQPMEIKTGGTGENANAAFYSLSAAAVQYYLGKKIDFSKIPTDDDGRFLLLAPDDDDKQVQTDSGAIIEEHTPVFTSQFYPFSVAYDANVKDLHDVVNGAIVFIGDTAQAQGDLIQTARGANFPGLFANARMAQQLLEGWYIKPAPSWFNILLMIALPLLVALSFNFVKTSYAIAIGLGGAVVYGYANLALFVKTLTWIDLIHVGISMILATLFVGLYRVIVEQAQKRMVTNLFGMHVSPAIVNDILSSEDPKAALALKGKKVKATIFYSDIRGFTAMSETMTPEAIYSQLNEYFEEMCAIIFHYGGYVDKFIGDCVMAVFSAPYQTPDDAKNAVLAAVAQQKKIQELAAKWKAEGKREFTVGMGINTGDVVMGNLGSSNRMNYTVIGDNVNLAARLYNVAKAGEIIISDYTYQEVKDLVVAEDREPVLVKGKKDPIMIYNITDVKEGVFTPTNGAAPGEPATV